MTVTERPALKFSERNLTGPLIVAVLAFAFILARLLLNDFDPSRFVYAGDNYTDQDLAPPGLYVFAGDVGYDGQFFYRLALDPFTRVQTENGITLDAPSYRHQRIVYPLLAWALSLGGRPALVPWALIGVNLIGLFVLGLLGTWIARRFGRPRVYGLVLPLYPGFVVTLARDLSEIVAATLLVGGIALILSGKHGWAGVCLSLGVLSRETTVAFAVAGCVMLAIRRLKGGSLSGLNAFLPPVFVFVGWQVALKAWWGEAPIEVGSGLLGIPLAGFITSIPRWNAPDSTAEVIGKAMWLVLVVAFFILVGRRLVARRGEAVVRGGALAYMLIAATLTPAVWLLVSAFLRALTEAYVLGSTLILEEEDQPLGKFLSVVIVAWVLQALVRL